MVQVLWETSLSCPRGWRAAETTGTTLVTGPAWIGHPAGGVNGGADGRCPARGSSLQDRSAMGEPAADSRFPDAGMPVHLVHSR